MVRILDHGVMLGLAGLADAVAHGPTSFELHIPDGMLRASPAAQDLPRERLSLECLDSLFKLCERRTPEEDPLSLYITMASEATPVLLQRASQILTDFMVDEASAGSACQAWPGLALSHLALSRLALSPLSTVPVSPEPSRAWPWPATLSALRTRRSEAPPQWRSTDQHCAARWPALLPASFAHALPAQSIPL